MASFLCLILGIAALVSGHIVVGLLLIILAVI